MSQQGRLVVALVLTALVAGSCSLIDAGSDEGNGDGVETSSEQSAADDTESSDNAESPEAIDDAGESTDGASATSSSESEIVEVTLPVVPAVALPDISELSSTGDLVAAQLGDLVSGPLGGVELVSVSCADEGDLVYSGSQSEDDVFDIGQDGSGEYREESEDGLVSLVVDAEGAGQFIDSTSGALTTISVKPDGTGEYYSERNNDLVTIKVTGPGTGEYYDNRDRQLLTVRLAEDGSGEYYLEGEEGLLTVAAQRDGSGEYYNQIAADGATTTLDVRPDGTWTLNLITSSQRLEISVQPDGSGSYRDSGLSTLEFDFDSIGNSTDPEIPVQLVLPDPPRFHVADTFPPLGKLGSLTPPCATVIRFDSALLFDFGSSELRNDTVELLDQVVLAVNEVDKPIEIVGHTDAIGSDEANLDLSLLRAEAVAEALRDGGMDVDAATEGVGESQPVAPNENADGSDNPTGREQNRRVEIIIRE